MNDDKKRAERKRRNEATRTALIRRLIEEGAGDIAEKLKGCGEPFPLTCTNCGGVHETETRCRARWCPVCQPLVSAERHRRWAKALEKMEWPLFVTLTIPNSEDPESLRFLKKKWAAFRRRKIIADRVKGGVATFEVTNKGEGWHPHLHAVMDCRWLAIHTPEPMPAEPKEVKAEKCRRAQEELSAAWADMIGKPEAVVWVRRVYGTAVVHEVLKYAAKGSELVASPDPIAPMLRVLKSTRTLAGWGNLHPLPSPDADQEASVECQGCGALASFVPSEIAFKFGAANPERTPTRTVKPQDQKNQ